MHQLIKELKELKLSGMAQCLEEQIKTPINQNLTFEERFSLLVNHELTLKKNRKIRRLLKASNLKLGFRLEDMEFDEKRGLARSQFLNLLRLDFIKTYQNVIITGATGCGKTHLACAIGNKACIDGYKVKFIKLPTFLEEIQLSHKTGNFIKTLQTLLQFDILILDDLGITSIDKLQLHDLFNIIDERYKTKSTIITSQLPIKEWHGYLGDPTIADAILDRLLSQTNRIELLGKSLRWKENKNNENSIEANEIKK